MTSDGEILRACGRRPHRHGGVADSGHAPAIWSECEFTRSLGLVRANTPGRHLDGPLAQHELGQLLRIDRTTMVAVVDHLERLGFVLRGLHSVDRRTYQVQLTAAGQAALEQARGALAGADAALVDRLSAQEGAQLVTLLHKLGPGKQPNEKPR